MIHPHGSAGRTGRVDGARATTFSITAAMVTAVAVTAMGTVGCGGEPPTPGVQIADESAAADYRYTIPAGTGARLDDGQRFEILPEQLEVRVGETIEIINDDERGHVIGVFYVGPNETLRQTFTEAGTLIGECSIHPSGSFSLTVVV
jgi:plastocyanin